MDPFVPLRGGASFADMSWELDNNRATLEEKGHKMYHSAVTNETLTLTKAINYLSKVGIKVIVSKLCRDSHRPVDVPLPMCCPQTFF